MKAAKKACRECPFRKQSLGGWLGPWKSAQELLTQAFSESGLACHMMLHLSHEEGGTPVCTGSLVCANKSGKLYRDRELNEAQNTLIAHPDEDILHAQEFLVHHRSRVKEVG